eukprot:2637312-Prymnesium_polylepis.1
MSSSKPGSVSAVSAETGQSDGGVQVASSSWSEPPSCNASRTPSPPSLSTATSMCSSIQAP